VTRMNRFHAVDIRVASVLVELASVTMVTLAVALVIPATNAAKGSYCPPIRGSHAEVRDLSARLGCGVPGTVALRTVDSNDGYFKSQSWYCRWGQGGTRPIRLGGYVYFGGFCASKPSYREVSFLGRRL
jgi:hypothetical protein